MKSLSSHSLNLSFTLVLSALTLMLTSCAEPQQGASEAVIEVPEGQLAKDPEGKSDASALAVFLDMSFEGSLKSSFNFDLPRVIEQQLLFTIGQLNGEDSVGRLDQLKLSEVNATPLEGGGYEVKYKASLLVAWKHQSRVPERYTLVLPYDTTYEGQRAFTESYKSRCVSWGAHDVDEGSIWYYYRPLRSDCELKEEDVRRVEATVSLSPVMTAGKYPEYHKVWEDETFQSLVIFGRADEEGPISNDVGFSGYRSYFNLLHERLIELGATELKVSPEISDMSPSPEQTDITIEATLPSGERVIGHLMLIDNVRTAGPAFDERYHELSRDADLVVYNGHAGLGANIRALARKGDWREGQYKVFFMNGCDTYAYVDEALFEAHAAVNPDDPTGRKHVDIVNNAMPSYFFSMPKASMAMINGLLSLDSPMTYEAMFAQVDPSQVILVTGEEDNVFVPGYDPRYGGLPPEPILWGGLSHEGSLTPNEAWRYETPVLEPGSYRFIMDGSGDADLYLRVGMEPSMTEFDCRPFSLGSQEACDVELSSPAAIHVMVHAWYQRARFQLDGGLLK